MALAERRSFPETRFLEARGMVGETWSLESLVVTVTLRSALVLQLREPSVTVLTPVTHLICTSRWPVAGGR